MRSFFTLFLLLLTVPAAHTGEPLRLNSNFFPEHQLMVSGSASEQSLEILECVLSNINQEYRVTVLPWARALEELKQDAADGVFTVAPSIELNEVAKMSAPFSLERWYWYFLPKKNNEIFSAQGKVIGVVRSSNVDHWLKEHNLQASIEVNSTEQLLRMLLNGRIDGFLEDQDKVLMQLKALGIKQNTLDSDFSHYMPLGVYFSNKLLQRTPDFLNQFNQQLPACTHTSMGLSALEVEKIEELVRLHLKVDIEQIKDLKKAIRAENKRLKNDSTSGERFDRQWLADLGNSAGPLFERVSKHPISLALQRIQLESAGLISEIYLTGIKGFNLAMSQPTSDFDQSDEAEYTAVIINKMDFFVADIDYDESSQRFQVKTAWPVKDGDKDIGMVVVGIDVEHGLRSMEYYFDMRKHNGAAVNKRDRL